MSARARARELLERIRAVRLDHTVRIMNVCGGHERAISMAGLRSLLPETVALIPGPGCPVCVCPEEDILQAIHWAMTEDIRLASFGDMLRVPVNLRKSEIRSLEQARAAGANVHPVAGPADVLALARADPARRVVFFVAGFETTAAPIAAMLAQGIPDNLSILLSARRTWPAIEGLLRSGETRIDALIAPGHVCSVTGSEEWDAAAGQYGIPTAVAGFEPVSLLSAVLSVLTQIADGTARLENCYPGVVQAGGNAIARRCLDQAFEIADAPWRGLGTLPKSGYRLRPAFAAQDARNHLTPLATGNDRPRAGQMPAGCDCAAVVTGRISPRECRIYGSACTPRHPIGPCMVSEEGACRIWWAAGVRAADVQPSA